MKRKLFKILALMLLLSGCGLVSGLKDLTKTANDLLENINSITKQIDSKVESGELSEEVGNLIDERLSTLAQLIESAIQNNGGFLFDQVNGTIDNAFLNISLLLDQIKTGILDESLPNIINQVSMQLQMNINTISASIEDLVVLTFGNAFVLVDKTVNSAIILISVILLAIGFIIFITMLFRKDRKLTALRAVGLGFMVIYLAFFLLIILSSQVRGNIIAGFNFGEKYEGIEVKPSITSVFPETFVIGKNDKIFLYGKHLNKIDTLKVVLKTGNQVKFTFPENTLIVKSQNRIVLGNFKSTLNWKIPSFEVFKAELGASFSTIVSSAAYTKYAENINNKMYASIAPKPSVAIGKGDLIPIQIISNTPKEIKTYADVKTFNTVTKFTPTEIKQMKATEAASTLGQAQANLLTAQIENYFTGKFLLPEGDYGIIAIDNKTQVESPQLFTVFNPPPPPPDPDIYPLQIMWTGNTDPVAKKSATIDIKLGFSHPEQIKNQFNVRLTSTPVTTSLNITVPMGKIAAAQSSNQVVVTSGPFTIQNPGIYNFKVEIDNNNVIKEKNEGNNTTNANLTVRSYIYDVTVKYISFESTANHDGWPAEEDEYRIDIRTNVTGYSEWKIDFNKNGEPGNVYNINKQQTFNNLVPGNTLIFNTSGYEEDDGANGSNDYMGQFTKVINLGQDPTSGLDTKEFEFNLPANDYKIIGRYTIVRRIQ
jgi:hypothetical protein